VADWTGLRYKPEVDNGGQTVSATEFARLTGVSRERLRTWERRFGFPRPTRLGQGRRRYALSDAARVVAVRRAAEQGVPLARAIEDADGAAAAGASPALLADVAAAAPVPIVLVAGPEPLRVAYVNRPLHAPGGIAVGQELSELPWFLGSDLERTLRTLFASDTEALECVHPAWTGEHATAHSIAYRLPVGRGAAPAVALVGLERGELRETRRELGELRRELRWAQARGERQRRWLALAAALAERFQREAGEALLGATADTLVRRLGAEDAAIAVYVAGELALGGSSRGRLGPRVVPVPAFDDLAELTHKGRPGWLSPATGAAFGVAEGLHSLVVPITVVGERLGILLLLFEQADELDEDVRRILQVVSAGLGFTILRDRLVASGRSGGQPGAGT
jgi:MerR family transcriptional regulator, light-induced transcriptional regulator